MPKVALLDPTSGAARKGRGGNKLEKNWRTISIALFQGDTLDSGPQQRPGVKRSKKCYSPENSQPATKLMARWVRCDA